MIFIIDLYFFERVSILWYEDRELINLSMQHDNAMDNEDISLMKELIEKSIQNGNNIDNHPMVRAHHYYNAATTIGDLTNLLPVEERRVEESLEKSLFLFRESISLQEEYHKAQQTMDLQECGYCNSLYNSSIVNYSNVLSGVGRVSLAI